VRGGKTTAELSLFPFPSALIVLTEVANRLKEKFYQTDLPDFEDASTVIDTLYLDLLKSS